MAGSSSDSVKMERLRNIAAENPEKSVDVEAPEAAGAVTKNSEDSTSADVEAVEDVVVKNIASVDTTDKKAKQENTFAAKKTVAQGMMDVALITANANQLRYLFEYQRNSPTFYFIVILIAISLLLQVAVGVSLIFKGRYDLKGKSKCRKAQMINNYVVAAVFLITIINVFIAAFSISAPTTQPL
ncbi:PREDICTED: ninjurin-1-like [Dinoponera quadriceps]|uniref:Ninjurin-1-like n=1 Tax=Dinoponera quadriceps TaxID=609295 RepID=A0A6P3XWI8_DINQU|nr:PREDICTED: ninjurin-1-like [Dinoponera quadriceps]